MANVGHDQRDTNDYRKYVSHTFTVQDSTNITVNKGLSLTIDPYYDVLTPAALIACD